MKIYIRLCLIILISLCSISFDSKSLPLTYACSGPSGPPPLNRSMENTDYVVRATVVDVDSVHQNVLVQVKGYVNGGAKAEYIVIQRNAPMVYRGDVEEWEYCDAVRDWIEIGDEGIFFLQESESGIYRSYNEYLFPTEDLRTFVYYDKEDGTEVLKPDASIDDVVTTIEEFTGEASVSPNYDLPKPLHSPLLIYTSNNSAYILPADLSTPVLLGEDVLGVQGDGSYLAIFQKEGVKITQYPSIQFFPFEEKIYCSTPECFAIAAQGVYMAFRQDESQIRICISLCSSGIPSRQIKGQAFRFSPTGDRIAILNNGTLSVYQMPKMDFGYGEDFIPRLIGSFPVEASDLTSAELQEHTIWSNDGQNLAYSDNQGLWVWKRISQESSPQLLIEGGAYARYFSPLGNYLAVIEDNVGSNIDLTTNSRLPDGLFSPDERSLAMDRLQVCDMMNLPCEPDYSPFTGDMIWTRNGDLLGMGCDQWAIEGQICGLYISRARSSMYPFGAGRYNGLDTYPAEDEENPYSWDIGNTFIYDPIGDTVAILNDNHTVSIVYSTVDPAHVFLRQDYITLDLADKLDGEITHMEWLPSAFYQGIERRYQ
jgi:hypothetical protein